VIPEKCMPSAVHKMDWQYIVFVLILKLQITKKLKHGEYKTSDMDG
jgi:hypothetical protein